jgi:hypothetical protein
VSDGVRVVVGSAGWNGVTLGVVGDVGAMARMVGEGAGRSPASTATRSIEARSIGGSDVPHAA